MIPARPRMAAVPIERLGDKVTRIIAARIVDAPSAPGEAAPLPTEQEICQEFGVSKTVAREVIARLDSLRLVTVRHGKRMQPRPPMDWNYLDPLMLELQNEDGVRVLAGELHDARLLIEPEAAARAAESATAEQTARMRGSLDMMRHALTAPEVFLEHDIAFHQEVVAAANNRVISYVLDAISDLMRTSRRLTNAVPGGLRHAVADHAAVLAAIEARDAEAARVAMREHILWGARRAGFLPPD